MRGDTIEIRDNRGGFLWGIGFIESPTNEFGDTIVFIRNDYGFNEYGELVPVNNTDEPRWFYATNVDPKFEMIYTTTRMVLTEKNRYAINHGGKNIDDTWI